MYYRQRGFIPTVITIVGLFIIGYSLVGSLWATYMYAIKIGAQASPLELSVRLLVNFCVFFFIVLLPFNLFALFLTGLFPEIRIVEAGIKYRYMYIIKGTISWEEIDEIVAVEKRLLRDCVAVAIVRKGLALFNGLWLNVFYGMTIRHEYPVLLLSPGLEKRGKVLDEITKRTGLHVKHY